MKKTLALLFLLCMAGMAAAQDDLSDQLRKAIVEEEANQNLDKAIKAYDAILKQYDKQRVTAATALFHLADCYRKQGEKESAIAAYKRLVREFPEQTKLAGASRNYLTSVYNTRPEPDTADAMRTRIKELETALTRAKNNDQLVTLLTELEESKGDQKKIAEIQKQLADLTEKYSPEHPDVIRLIEAQRQAEVRRQLEAERQIEAQRQAEFERQAELERLASLESAQKRGQLIEEHIALVESQIRETEKAVNTGTASSKELYQLKKELLALKERLADHQHSVNLYKLHN